MTRRLREEDFELKNDASICDNLQVLVKKLPIHQEWKKIIRKDCV